MGLGWGLEEKPRRVGTAFWVEGKTAVSIPTLYDYSTLIFLNFTLSSHDSGGAEIDLANQTKYFIHLLIARIQNG